MTLEERIRALIAHHAPDSGVAVAVIREGASEFHCFGRRDRERDLPVTTRTTFEICSLTKPFTAAALLIANEQGRVDLDAPINADQPLIPLADPATSSRVSIADLLSHRIGMPANDLRWYLGRLTRDELPRVLGQLALVPGGFRSTFNYNNLLYGALGHRFEMFVGEPWEQRVRRTLLAPLGMTATSFTGPLTGDDIAMPYAAGNPISRVDTSVVAAAGGMRSTIEDMATWTAMFLNNGLAAAGARVLAEVSIRRMFTEHVSATDANPLFFQGLPWLTGTHRYGLGWFLDEVRGHPVVHAPGFIDGFSTQIVLIPTERLGVVVLMNDNLSPVPGLIAGDVVAMTLGEPTLAGRYENAAYGTIEVVPAAADLAVRYNGHAMPLVKKSDGTFELTLSAFGIQMPLPVAFDVDRTHARSIAIPFALDPRIPPNVFVRS